VIQSHGRPSLRPVYLAPIVLVLGLAAEARAANIVQDSGFELAAPSALAGDLNFYTNGQSIDGGIWNVTQGTVGVDTSTSFVFDGSKSLLLDGDNGGPDSLTQVLSTTPGQLYTLSFWANADVPNSFSATFGGVTVAGLPTSIAQNGFPGLDPLSNSSHFQLYTATARATSASTALTFTTTAFPTLTSGVTVELDDVVVSAVPEPSTLALAGIGLLTVAVAVRRGARKRRFASRRIEGAAK
jgi:hypothetical protein